MAQVDVPDYYKYAADNLKEARRLVMHVVEHSEKIISKELRKALRQHRLDPTLTLLAATMGLTEEDSFNIFARTLFNRHVVSNQIQGILGASDFIPDSPEREKLKKIIRRIPW